MQYQCFFVRIKNCNKTYFLFLLPMHINLLHVQPFFSLGLLNNLAEIFLLVKTWVPLVEFFSSSQSVTLQANRTEKGAPWGKMGYNNYFNDDEERKKKNGKIYKVPYTLLGFPYDNFPKLLYRLIGRHNHVISGLVFWKLETTLKKFYNSPTHAVFLVYYSNLKWSHMHALA